MSTAPQQRASEQAAPKRKPGRPTTYTTERGMRICEAIADGATVEQACRAEGITVGVLFRWKEGQRELGEAYARARDVRAEVMAGRLEQAAAEATPENVHVARLRVDTMKWAASKLAPKSYGDRVGVEHSGKDGEPLKVLVEVIGGGESQ